MIKMFFSVITKDLKWEILTDYEWKFLIFWGFTEKSDFQRGSEWGMKILYIGELPKKGGLDSLQI